MTDKPPKAISCSTNDGEIVQFNGRIDPDSFTDRAVKRAETVRILRLLADAIEQPNRALDHGQIEGPIVVNYVCLDDRSYYGITISMFVDSYF